MNREAVMVKQASDFLVGLSDDFLTLVNLLGIR